MAQQAGIQGLSHAHGGTEGDPRTITTRGLGTGGFEDGDVHSLTTVESPSHARLLAARRWKADYPGKNR